MGVLEHITADPMVFGGKPVIRGMRISVELILSLYAKKILPLNPSKAPR